LSLELANLPNTGFSLDELVVETKRMFETEGMVEYLLFSQVFYQVEFIA